MSPFENHLKFDKELWEARAMRFAQAIVILMEGLSVHDVQADTGLPLEECQELVHTKLIAAELIRQRYTQEQQQ